MFGEFGGLPVHVLVLHLAVVIVPVAALAGMSLLVPKFRAAMRWPFVVLAALATVTIFVTKQSGQQLESTIAQQLEGNVTGELVADHERLGNRLFIAVIVLLMLSLVAALVLPRIDHQVVGLAVAVVVAIACIGVTILAIQTGEAGAKAVWNPADSIDYSAH
ncbi:DUF2231 domain-containing protein [Williamsia muralis]|uniref:DUF2231 domain-containing protein n=1 Tax=Williamsia marianensis TaxID=85044 RepID=A0ABU4F1C8_WILMA|nr:DUF2231 domain-containing protein [Williamsia muralis]MDV7136791.1 DUF2231 domain-containing protein [Williamsia muralis]